MDDEAGQIVRGEDQIGAERHVLLAEADRQAVQAEAGREPALFVIFAIIGQEGLRHDAEDAAAVERHRAIVEPAVADERGADEQQRREAGGLVGDGADGAFAGALLRRLQMQIVDRVGGEVEFGKDDEIDAAIMRLARHGDGRGDVGGDVADAGERRRRRDAGELVAMDRGEGVGHEAVVAVMAGGF